MEPIERVSSRRLELNVDIGRGRVEVVRFNDVLLQLGYARFLVILPNDLHARDMLMEELDARRHCRGLRASC